MKLGIIQGRLSEPVEGFQDTPANWEREFDLLTQLELNHVEWIVTKDSFENNPIFTEELEKYSIRLRTWKMLIKSKNYQKMPYRN